MKLSDVLKADLRIREESGISTSPLKSISEVTREEALKTWAGENREALHLVNVEGTSYAFRFVAGLPIPTPEPRVVEPIVPTEYKWVNGVPLLRVGRERG